MIISTVDTADAEPYTIQGGFDGNSIVILIDGIDNAITLNYDGNTSYHYDGKLKTYSSGGFVIKNLDTGIVVFGHPVGNEQYRLVLLTDDGIFRLIGVTMSIVDVVTPSYEEPVSSVGADITKYDVPNTLDRDSGKDTFLMAFKPMQVLDMIRLGDKLDYSGTVWNARNNTDIENADVTLEISRDDYILKSVQTKSGTGGYVRVEIDDMIYPMFYPKMCYDITVTVNYGNYTIVHTEDFVMEYVMGTRVWEPNMDWLIEDRYDYLPESFRQEPRVSINADAHCN